MNLIATTLFVALLAGSIETANILGFLPLPSKSHHVMFERIFKELARRGHDVDFVSHFPLKNPPKGYNDLSLEGSLKIFVNNLTIDAVRFTSHLDTLNFMLHDCGTEVCKVIFQTDVLKKLKTTKKKYDVIIAEIFGSDCVLGFADLFKIPIIGVTSSVNLPWGSDRFANPDNPSYIPNYFTEFSPRMNLWERMWNTVLLLIAKTQFYWTNYQQTKLAREFFGPQLPDLNDLVYNTSLLLVNSHFSMNQARPTVPGFVEVGGVHINDPQPLNKHFQDLLTTDTEGIIYLSMGSMVKTESFPVHKTQAIFDALEELPFKVVWKANFEEFPKELRFPKNIHFEKWMPQLDILCSPNVKLFISHGGLMGSQEAMYCGVPRLGIPIFADQELNIKQAENMGQAIKVDFEEISKEKILNAAKELLYNPVYTEKVKEFSDVFKDRPSTPLETSMYWIEYVIRHKGAHHLKSVATELYWYQYYLLDVGFILLAAFVLSLYLLIKIPRRLMFR